MLITKILLTELIIVATLAVALNLFSEGPSDFVPDWIMRIIFWLFMIMILTIPLTLIAAVWIY